MYMVLDMMHRARKRKKAQGAIGFTGGDLFAGNWPGEVEGI